MQSACDICDGRGAKTYRQGKLVTTEDMDKEAAAKGTKPVWAQNAT